MLKKYLISILAIAFCVNCFSQNNDIVKEFIAGSISDKINVLNNAKEAGADSIVNETALEFVGQHYRLFEDDNDFSTLVLASINGVGSDISSKNISLLQKIYTSYENKEIRLAIINKIPFIKANTAELINNLNIYVENTIESKSIDDNEIFNAAVNTIALSANPSSFKVLFDCLSKNLVPELNAEILNSLQKMARDNRSQIVAIIANNQPKEKLLALEICQKKVQNSDFFYEEMAETALAISINNNGDAKEKNADSVNLQLAAMRVISESSWTRASSLMVRYFDIAKKQYAAKIITTANMVEIIECLSRLPSIETGQALSAYLASLNKENEKTLSYDKDILLAVINSLGVLGEKSAFEQLLYVISYSNYPEEIISASRDTLARLKW